MLMLPAANVSVPFTVVMRTRSRVPERVTEPPPNPPALPAEIVGPPPIEPDPDHAFAVMFTIVNRPPNVLAASIPPVIGIPDIVVIPAIADVAKYIPPPVYPEVAIALVVPSWAISALVPLVRTPLNITVTRFTQLGMPVKSMLVPLVLGTKVPLLMMLLGAAIVVLPSVFKTTLLLPELGFLRLVVESVLMIYSQRRLIDPASNVSVPFTVVMRTRSRVPERVLSPMQEVDCVVDILSHPEATQVLAPRVAS